MLDGAWSGELEGETNLHKWILKLHVKRKFITFSALLDSMVVNFVTKFPRGVVWYWYWNWNWFWIWFLKIYADGPLQKVFLSISTDIHDGQFQGRE